MNFLRKRKERKEFRRILEAMSVTQVHREEMCVFEDWVRLYLPELNPAQIKMLLRKVKEIK